MKFPEINSSAVPAPYEAPAGRAVPALSSAPPRESATRRSLRAVALSAVNLGMKIGSNFVIIPLALKYLGRDDYGLWIILQSIVNYLALSELGLGQTVLNRQAAAYARGDYAEVSRILTTSFGLYWFLVIPVWVVSVLLLLTQPVGAWLLRDAPASMAAVFLPYLFLFATLTLFRVPLNVFAATLLGLREVVWRQVYEVALTLFLVAGTILTLVFGGKVLALIVVTNLGLIALPVLAYRLAVFRHPQVRLAWRFWTPKQLVALLSNSSFFFLLGLGLLFQRLAGNLLAGKFGSLGRVPEIFVLLTLFRVVGWSLADILSRTVQPYVILFAVQQRQDRVVFFAKLCTKCTFASGVIYSALLWLFADVGIRAWLGPGMFLGYGPLACLAGSFLIDVLFLSTNNFLIALNRHKGLSLAMASYALLSFVLGVVGAKWWMPANPLYGLCAGFLAASILAQACTLPWITQRWLQMGWRRYADQFLFRPGLLAVGSVLLLAGIALAGVIGPSSRAFGTSCTLVLLPLLTWFLVLDDREREWILGLRIRLNFLERET